MQYRIILFCILSVDWSSEKKGKKTHINTEQNTEVDKNLHDETQI